MGGLKEKTVKGVVWSGFDKFTTLFVQSICGLIIARFVLPHDYGIVGIIFIFISICNTLVDSGFSQVLIRKKTSTDVDYSTIFYLNIFIGILIYVLIFYLSPSLEAFYNIENLSTVSRVAFIVIPINSFSLIQYTLLQKKIDFKQISKINIISVGISAIVGVFAAYIMRNVWALVLQNLLYSIIRMALLWCLNKWQPIFTFSFQSLKEMFPLSISLLLYSLLSTITNNIYGLIIGKAFSSKELGLYSQAEKLEKIPSESFTDVINKVTFPVLSKLQDDDEQMKYGYKKIIKITFFILSPILLFLSIESQNIFSIILPPEWEKANVYFSLLCWTGIMFPLHKINLNILIVKGKGRTNILLEVIRKSIMIAMLFFTLSYGIEAVLLGYIAYSFIALFINMHYCGKLINLSIKEQLMDILPIFILTLTFYPINYLVDTIITNNLFHVVVTFLLCALFYIGISYILKLSVFKDIINLIKVRNG